MQQVDPRGRGVRTIAALVAVVTASALAAVTYGGSPQIAPDRTAHVCPPAC